MKGNIFIISAPSGAGKTTLCRMLLESTPGIVFSISYTTRPPRPGEVDGKDYYFVDEKSFMDMVRAGEFLEWAEVHGNLYGTSKKKTLEIIQHNTDVLLDIDVQGAAQIRQKGIEATYVFILPPSLDALRKRLEHRRTDSEDVIMRRLQNAIEEIRAYSEYDYIIVNDRLEVALEYLRSVVLSRRVEKKRISHEWVRKTFLT